MWQTYIDSQKLTNWCGPISSTRRYRTIRHDITTYKPPRTHTHTHIRGAIICITFSLTTYTVYRIFLSAASHTIPFTTRVLVSCLHRLYRCFSCAFFPISAIQKNSYIWLRSNHLNFATAAYRIFCAHAFIDHICRRWGCAVANDFAVSYVWIGGTRGPCLARWGKRDRVSRDHNQHAGEQLAHIRRCTYSFPFGKPLILIAKWASGYNSRIMRMCLGALMRMDYDRMR